MPLDELDGVALAPNDHKVVFEHGQPVVGPPLGQASEQLLFEGIGYIGAPADIAQR